MEREAASAMYAKLHEDAPYHDGSFRSWAKERSQSHPYHFGDGVTFGVAAEDIAPHDKFTTEVDASPVAPVRGGDEADHAGDDADDGEDAGHAAG